MNPVQPSPVQSSPSANLTPSLRRTEYMEGRARVKEPTKNPRTCQANRQAGKKLSLPLKPPGRPQDRHGLIHHPLPHTEILVDPFLDVLVIGYFAGFKAGAAEDPTRPTGPRQGELISLFANFSF